MSGPVEEGLRARELADQAVRELTIQAAEKAAEKAADRAADRAVERVFLLFGVNINDDDEVRALKDDLGFLARTNRGAKVVKKTTITTCIGALVTGFIAIMLTGFKDTLLSWLPHIKQ